MYYDRFDIVSMSLPSPSFNVDSLTSNGKEIYESVCNRLLEK